MKVELCTQAQKEETLDVLCDAFHEYPVMRYVLADSGPDSDGDLRALIDLFCQARLTHGLSLYGIRHEGPSVAVSVHQRPHRAALSPAAISRIPLRRLPIRETQVRSDRMAPGPGATA